MLSQLPYMSVHTPKAKSIIYSFRAFENLFKLKLTPSDMIKIHTIGGYNEVGKNMTALEIGEDVILFDAGLFLPAIVGVEEREKIPTEMGMRSLGALPDDLYLDRHNLRHKVRAIVVSHAHLDHVGAIPYLAERYNAEIIATPFTIELLKSILADSAKVLKNKLVSLKPNGTYVVKGHKPITIEMINITHSTIQCGMIAVHTPVGVVLYGNDYKFDNTPVIGDKPNYKRLKELSRVGIKALVVDCLYASDERKTPSEKIARGLLEDVLFTTDNDKSGIIITTFSSHIARLKSIVEFGKKLNREIIFLGRSLNKYVSAAQAVGAVDFLGGVKIARYRNQVEKFLKVAAKNKPRTLIVCTGHQGEPGSILDRIARQDLKYPLEKGDHIIFSSKTIPSPANEANRAELEKKLKKRNVRIFDNVHVSGHGGREDLRDLITITNPVHVIPSHGDTEKLKAGADLAIEMGYKLDKDVHIMFNGHHLEFS